MKTYTLESLEKLIDIYINQYNGVLFQVLEGCLGLGEILLYNAKGKKTIIIKELYLNDWNCTHTVKKYNKMPKKYKLLIDNI
jgi:hypothetical protein